MQRMRSSLLGWSRSQDNQKEQEQQPSVARQEKLDNDDKVWVIQGNDNIQQQQQPIRQGTFQQIIHSFRCIIQQIPSIILIGLFHMMIGIPFGVSYFPIEWEQSISSSISKNELVDQSFPVIPGGKEILGIRMFLFATLIGQIVFTLKSGFQSPIGLQMVENVPFNHAMAYLVIRRQGYGLEALSTLFLLFALSSILVGLVFWILGHCNLGRIVYYIPNHVLVGCIAGIGIFLIRTGLEVTMNAIIWEAWRFRNLVAVVVVLEIILRILEILLRDKHGKPQYTLLSPIYFCLITPTFYLGLWILGISIQYATDEGFFFPSLQQVQGEEGNTGMSILSTLTSMWRIIDIRSISIPAIMDSISTMVALTLFSLIHVPINIPAFSVTTGE
jgi:sulfate permease, SulP family